MNAAFGVLFFFAFLIILAIWFICLFGGGNAILIFGIIQREGRRGDVLNVFVLEVLILFIILPFLWRAFANLEKIRSGRAASWTGTDGNSGGRAA
jgi:hypothetical protein